MNPNEVETEQEKILNYIGVDVRNGTTTVQMTAADVMSFAIRKALAGETWFICRIESKVEPHIKITDYPKTENE